eukprot:6382490-Pyramimonas_sp.AAC.1
MVHRWALRLTNYGSTSVDVDKVSVASTLFGPSKKSCMDGFLVQPVASCSRQTWFANRTKANLVPTTPSVGGIVSTVRSQETKTWCGTSESTGAIKIRLASSSTVLIFTQCRLPKHISQVAYRVAVDEWCDVEIAQQRTAHNCLNTTVVVHQKRDFVMSQADAEELIKAHLEMHDLHLVPQKRRDFPAEPRET